MLPCTLMLRLSFFLHTRVALDTYFLLYLGALNVPVLLRIVLDGTVGAKFAHLPFVVNLDTRRCDMGWGAYLGGRSDALLDPFGAVVVGFVDHAECFNVCVKSGHAGRREWDARQCVTDAQESKSSVSR